MASPMVRIADSGMPRRWICKLLRISTRHDGDQSESTCQWCETQPFGESTGSISDQQTTVFFAWIKAQQDVKSIHLSQMSLL